MAVERIELRLSEPIRTPDGCGGFTDRFDMDSERTIKAVIGNEDGNPTLTVDCDADVEVGDLILVPTRLMRG